MCEVHVFMVTDGEKETIMENVISIKPEGDKLLLVDLFGEQKYIDAKIKEIKLLEHQVVLENV